MRPCTRRIASAEDIIKAPALTTSSANTLLGAEPPQTALLIHISL